MRTFEQWREIIRFLPELLQREGSPEGAIQAERGTLYLQTDAAQLFVKTTETGSTGWVELAQSEVTPTDPFDPFGILVVRSTGFQVDTSNEPDGTDAAASLVVGPTGAVHIEVGPSSIQSKTDETDTGPLVLQPVGGDVSTPGVLSATGGFESTAGAMLLGELSAGSVTTTSVSAGSVSATSVSAGTVDATSVTAGSVTSTGAISGANVTATSQLSAEADAAVDLLDSDAPLVVGPGAGNHLEIGSNGIQRKSDAGTASEMTLQPLGGAVGVTGRLEIKANTEVDLVNATAPLVVGATEDAHLEVGSNGVQWKSDEDTASRLPLNPLGGDITLGTASTRVFAPGTEAVDLIDGESALVIGPSSGGHLEFDPNTIQAKANATSATGIEINPLGGQVTIGQDAFNVNTVLLQNLTTEVRSQQTTALDLGNNADGNPTIGNAQSVAMRLVRSDGTLLSQFGFPVSVGLFIDSYNHGGIVTVRGEDAGGTLQNIFRGNPGGVAQLYNAGTSQIETADETATNRITGGLIRQRDSVGLVPIGAALLSEKLETSSFTVDIDHANRTTRVTGASTITLADDADLPLGAWGIIINNSGGNRSINAGAGVTIISGGIGSGNRTLANNGVIFWWHGHVDERYWLGNLGGLT